MSKEIILDKKYKQVPAGWVSSEQSVLGVTRVIDGVLHYAFDSRIVGAGKAGLFRREYETLWLPVKSSMLAEVLC